MALIQLEDVKVDGADLLDLYPMNRWFESFEQTPRDPFTVLEAGNGKLFQEFYILDDGTTWKAGSMAFQDWVGISQQIDSTSRVAFQDVFMAPFEHNMVTGILEPVYFHVDGVRTTARLDRQVLMSGYSKVNMVGVNSGAAAVDLLVTDRTGASYTVVYVAPAPGEVRLTTAAGPGQFRDLVFNAADITALDGAGINTAAIIVRAIWLYQIAAFPPQEIYTTGGNGRVLPATRYIVREKGEPG